MGSQAQLIVTLTITIVLTSLIVWGHNWIKRNQKEHPGIYKRRGVIGTVVYVILNLGDLLK